MSYPSKIQDPDALDLLPPPWLRIHHASMARFHRAVGEDYRGWCLVDLQDGLPVPVKSGDKVLDGFARKASQAMRVACFACGKPARQRRGLDRFWIQCPSCYGKAKLVEEVNGLLEACPRPVERPTFGKRAAWHEHELSARVQYVIPKSLWRSTSPPGARSVRYLGTADLLRVEPWLHQLMRILQHEINPGC